MPHDLQTHQRRELRKRGPIAYLALEIALGTAYTCLIFLRFPKNETDRRHIDVLKIRTRGDEVKHIAGTTSRNTDRLVQD